MNEIEDLNKTVDHQRQVNLAVSVLGGVGGLLSLGILAGVLCGKAYKTILQRLFIFAVCTVLVHNICHVANILYRDHRNHELCEFLGFLDNWMDWSVNCLYLGIELHLMVVAYLQVKATPKLVAKCKKSGVVFELVMVSGALLVPLVIIWVPYYGNEYGYDEGLCWFSSSSSRSTKLLYGYSFPEVHGSIAAIVALGLIIAYCSLSIRLRLRQARNIIRNLVILLVAAVLHMVVLNMFLAMEYSNSSSYHLQLIEAIFDTTDKYILLVGYLSAFHMTKACELIKKVKKNSHRDHLQLGKEDATYTESSRVTYPSHTFFSVSHTGEFAKYSA